MNQIGVWFTTPRTLSIRTGLKRLAPAMGSMPLHRKYASPDKLCSGPAIKWLTETGTIVIPLIVRHQGGQIGESY